MHAVSIGPAAPDTGQCPARGVGGVRERHPTDEAQKEETPGGPSINPEWRREGQRHSTLARLSLPVAREGQRRHGRIVEREDQRSHNPEQML